MRRARVRALDVRVDDTVTSASFIFRTQNTRPHSIEALPEISITADGREGVYIVHSGRFIEIEIP